MPELPEVETIKRRLAPLIIGKKFTQINILRDKSFRGDPLAVINQPIVNLERRAKFLRLQLANNLNILIHLKMTGQLIYLSADQRVGGGHPTADWVADLPVKHTRIILDLSDQAKLFFNDMRVFGWLWVMTNEQVTEEYSKYGPDINNPIFTADDLAKKLSKRNLPIKQAVMTNQIVSGVGNIYANEALFLAKIDPRRLANSLTKQEAKLLYQNLVQIIEKSIKMGGTTFDGKYVDVAGFAGGYQTELKVYGQEDQACSVCGQAIGRVNLGGRGTFFCANCQR